MPSSVRRLCILFAAALCAISLCAAASLTAAVLTGYDLQLHHFAVSHLPAVLSACFCVLGALVSLAFCVTVRVKKLSAAPSAPVPVTFISALVGFLLLFMFILTIASAEGWMQRIRLALMALSAFCFLISTQRTASVSPMRALLSLAPIAFAFLAVMESYFDASMSMNAPLKSYYLMMYLSMALFFTAEARVALDRIKMPAYCLFAGLCTVLAGAVGLSHILFALRGYALPLTLPESVTAAAIAVYAALRLFSLQPSPEAPAKEADEENN